MKRVDATRRTTGSWRKRCKLLFGRVEDGGVPRGPRRGVPEAVAGSGCWAAPDLGFGLPSWEDGSPRAVSLLKRAVS